MFSGPGAEVVKWQTRTFEGRVAQAVRVQVPPSAPNDAGSLPFPVNQVPSKSWRGECSLSAQQRCGSSMHDLKGYPRGLVQFAVMPHGPFMCQGVAL